MATVGAVPEPTFNQLLPPGPAIDADAYIEGLALTEHPDRPYTIANFVLSADGWTAFDGRSGPLSGPADREMFHALRARVDAILAGTETMQVERYGRTIPDPDTRAARLAAGRSAEPLAVLISRSGHLPLEIPLFGEPESRVIVFSPPVPALEHVAADVVRADGPGDLAGAMKRLRQDHNVKLLLCEGGPKIFAALHRERLIDELLLTLSPTLAGGATGQPLTAGSSLPQPAELQLRSILVREGAVFLRYVIPY